MWIICKNIWKFNLKTIAMIIIFCHNYILDVQILSSIVTRKKPDLESRRRAKGYVLALKMGHVTRAQSASAHVLRHTGSFQVDVQVEGSKQAFILLLAEAGKKLANYMQPGRKRGLLE